MARYTAVQIYAFARAAGFDPDQAVTMTAIALAESGGRSTAHATVGEDSRGLWQINAAAHPEFAGVDLWDPRANAAAAHQVSHGGADVSPWSTTHGGTRASYVRYRSQAQAAAAAYGEPSADGSWQGTSGYGHPLAAGHGHAPGEAVHGPQASADHGADHRADLSATQPVVTERAPEQRHGVRYADAPAESHADGTDPTGTDLTGTGLGVSGLGVSGVGVSGVGVSGVGDGVARGPNGGVDPMLQPVHTELAPQDRHGVSFLAGPLAGLLDGTGPASPAVTPHADGTPTTRADLFVAQALSQRGDRYVMGATADVNDPHPQAFDCSELVHWASARAGLSVPDGALPQFLALQEQGLEIPVEQAIHTPGALLFHFASPPGAHDMRPAAAHVAISLGNGHTIEARGRAYGVNEFDATTRRFQYAAVLPHAADPVPPGASTGVPRADVTTASAPARPATAGDAAVQPVDGRAVHSGGALLDTDGDGLPDRLELRLGLDPYQADTDHDALSDSFELLFSHTDPLAALPSDLNWNGAADAVLLADDARAGAGGPGVDGYDPGHPGGDPTFAVTGLAPAPEASGHGNTSAAFAAAAPQAPHDGSGHDGPGHDQPGHTQQGHDQPGHTQQGHDQAGHTQQGHPADAGTDAHGQPGHGVAFLGGEHPLEGHPDPAGTGSLGFGAAATGPARGGPGNSHDPAAGHHPGDDGLDWHGGHG